jgi:hypothetical protein
MEDKRWSVGKKDGTSFLPLFVFGALELFVNHTITQSMSLWFICLAAISALGAIGTVHMVWRAREESENEELLELLKHHHRLFILYYGGATAIALLFAYTCYAADLQANVGIHGMRGLLPLGLVLLIAIGLDGSALVSSRYWRKAVTYARTGRVPKPLLEHKLLRCLKVSG